MKILIATEKPFAPVAVKGIKEIAETAGLEVSKNTPNALLCCRQ